MTSDKQIEANRRNAQHSTGPNTDEGKEQSRVNAATNLTCTKIPLYPWENREEYREHCLGWLQNFKPVGPVETKLILRAAHNDWEIERQLRREHSLVMNAPSMVEAERHTMKGSLYRNRVQKNTKLVLDEFYRQRQARLSGESIDPPPDSNKYNPPELTYVILFPEDPDCQGFPHELPYDAPRQTAAERRAEAKRREAEIQACIPQTPEEERYPVKPGPETTLPARSFGMIADDDVEVFSEMLPQLPGPGEAELNGMFYRKSFRNLPKQSHCYPLRVQTPESYPQKMGSFFTFLRYPDLSEEQNTQNASDPAEDPPPESS